MVFVQGRLREHLNVGSRGKSGWHQTEYKLAYSGEKFFIHSFIKKKKKFSFVSLHSFFLPIMIFVLFRTRVSYLLSTLKQMKQIK